MGSKCLLKFGFMSISLQGGFSSRLGAFNPFPPTPGDPKLNPKKKPYDVASFHRLFNESGVSSTTDFRLMKGHNHGEGSELIWVFYPGPTKTEIQYPGGAKFSVEGGSTQKGDLIQWIQNIADADREFEHFVAEKS